MTTKPARTRAATRVTRADRRQAPTQKPLAGARGAELRDDGPPDALELVDSGKERHARAFPDADTEAVSYFAHLSALQHLTEIVSIRVLKPFRISYSEYRVLSTLRTRGPDYRATPHDLNRVNQLTSAGMTRTLDRLEQAGHIDRTPNPEDRRSVLIGLTEAGWRFAEEVVQAVAAEYSGYLADATATELRGELATLRRVIERLGDTLVDRARPTPSS